MNNLHLSDLAQADLVEIKSYIADELGNPSAALATVTRITKDIRRLQDNALLGASLVAPMAMHEGYRFLVSGSYLTFYRVQGQVVYIDRVLYGRRDYLRVLFEDSLGDAPTE